MTRATESLEDQEGRKSSSPFFFNAKILCESEHRMSEPCEKQPEARNWVKLMRNFMFDILGISECCCTGSGKIKIEDGVEFLFS